MFHKLVESKTRTCHGRCGSERSKAGRVGTGRNAAKRHRLDRSRAGGRGEEVGRGETVRDQSGRPECDVFPPSSRVTTTAVLGISSGARAYYPIPVESKTRTCHGRCGSERSKPGWGGTERVAARRHRLDRSGAGGRGEEAGRGETVQDRSRRPEYDASPSPRLATTGVLGVSSGARTY